MSDFVTWICAIFGRWQVSASGGGIGGAVIIILYILERLVGWTMPKIWYFLIFVVLFILSASFFVWKDEHQKVIALDQQLKIEKDHSKPNFNAEAGVTYVSPAGGKNESSIVLVLGIITNTGAPSIASHFQVSVKVKDTTTMGQFFPYGEKIVVPASKTSPAITLHRDDNLVKKSMLQPIPTGGAVQGYCIVFVPNVKTEDILTVGSIITLSFNDASGKNYTVEQIQSGKQSKILDIDKFL